MTQFSFYFLPDAINYTQLSNFDKTLCSVSMADSFPSSFLVDPLFPLLLSSTSVSSILFSHHRCSFLPPPILICTHGSVCASVTPRLLSQHRSTQWKYTLPQRPLWIKWWQSTLNKTTLYSMPPPEDFSFSALKGCLWCLLLGNNAFGTSCFEVINCLSSFLFRWECLSTHRETWETKYSNSTFIYSICKEQKMWMNNGNNGSQLL